jgi:hypothetical protein
MATIANLAVSLTAKIGNFEKGFKKAQRIAKKFSKDLTRHVKTISRYGLAIAGIATAAIGAMVKSQLSAIDSTSKLARTLGLSTEELAGYQHAINLAGGDTDGMNKSIIKMNRTIADAAGGLSTAIRELDRVGVSVEDLAELSTDQRIKLLADRYDSIGDAAGRASFLLNVFGRSGTAVGTLFEEGAEGIAKAQKEADALGITFSKIDGSKVERANDAMTRAGQAISGLGQALTIQLADYITVGSNRLQGFASQSEITGEIFVNSMNYIVESIGKVARAADGLKFAGSSITTGVNTVAAIGAGIVKKKMVGLVGLFKLFGSDKLDDEFSFVSNLTKGYAEAAEESAEKLRSSFSNLIDDTAGNKLKTYFQKFREEAEETGKLIDKIKLPGSTGSGNNNDQDDIDFEVRKTSQFKQINLDRVSLGGASSKKQKQEIVSPQIAETNSHLSIIRKSLTRGQAVLV